jgi:hypothetical protein
VTSITKVGKRCPTLSMARGSLPSISIYKTSQFYEQTVFSIYVNSFSGIRNDEDKEILNNNFKERKIVH